MMRVAVFIWLAVVVFGCKNEVQLSSVNPVNWEKRKATISIPDSMINQGTTYLSVYSEIYGMTEHKTHQLTATISMRNISLEDTLYITAARYYNTHGKLIRTYFDYPIYLLPMETVEIVIDQVDEAGGTGANFLFDWQAEEGINEPHFEAVMISTSGQQGLSFSTSGIRVR